MIKVCISGIGKTGSEILKLLLNQKEITVAAAVCRPGGSKLGKDIGDIVNMKKTGILVNSYDNMDEIIKKSKPDVIVDFSNPKTTLKIIYAIKNTKTRLVIGTTGFSEYDLQRVKDLTFKYDLGVVYTPNITLGVNVLMLLTNIAANILNNYDFHITEVHHKQKKDSPSGTAIKISDVIKAGINASENELDEEIPITAVRAGGVVGKHEVMIVGPEDKIHISHESFSRKAFANGALTAIRYIYKRNGFYEMKDVLNLEKVLNDCITQNSSPKQKYSSIETNKTKVV